MAKYVWLTEHVRVTREQTLDHYFFGDQKYDRYSAYIWLGFEYDFKVEFSRHKASLMVRAWRWPRIEMVYRFLEELREEGLVSIFGDPIPRGRKAIPKAIKDAVFKRDGKVCAYCGDLNGPFQLDHIFPFILGGTDTVKNLTVACRSCNYSKGKKTLAEWGGVEQ